MGEMWLAEPHIYYKKNYIEMVEEWVATGESFHPWMQKANYTNFEAIVSYFKKVFNMIEKTFRRCGFL